MEWESLPDDRIFATGGELPGSLNAYDRALEISRRQFQLEKEVAVAQIAAARAQESAAFWTMVSAIAVAVTVVLTGINVWIDS